MTWPWQLVCFDIDGTLTQGHGWRFLAERTGRLTEYDTTNRAFLAGRIGEDDHLRDLLNLAVGLERTEIEAILELTPKIGGITATVADLHDRGSRVAILSHNPEYVCDWYRRRFGFDDAAGTPGTRFEGGRVATYGAVRASKELGLSALLERAGADAERTVHVGDGWADAAIFPRVGAGVALNTRMPEVRQAADLALDLTDLRTLPGLLEPLVPRVV